MEILQEVISLFIAGVTEVAQGLGAGLSAIAKDIFIVETVAEGGAVTTELSTLGVLIVVFASVSLCLALFRKYISGSFEQSKVENSVNSVKHFIKSIPSQVNVLLKGVTTILFGSTLKRVEVRRAFV